MNLYEILLKKRDGKELEKEELSFFVRGCVDGSIPDYQISAMLMAIYFQGMTSHETAVFTQEMANSGEQMNWRSLSMPTVDKHSTGGVGDKTTLIVVPIVASLGVAVPKMSGRGLGHTGGTIDKLSAIPGFQTQLSQDIFQKLLKRNHAAVIAQSGNLAPADKVLYALRDVTATVDSLPLIASSIMSKKLALGADAILLDVKTGSGALMHDFDGSVRLAQTMVEIGNAAGRKTAALITDMDTPLGYAVGNALEVIEAVQTLKGKGPQDLTEVSLSLAAGMLSLVGKGSFEECYQLAEEKLRDGGAFKKFREIGAGQGGDALYLDEPQKFTLSPCRMDICSPADGYLAQIDTLSCGLASVLLGAGRQKKEDSIDTGAGILFFRTVGDPVKKGEPIARLYSRTRSQVLAAKQELRFIVSAEKPKNRVLIQKKIGFSHEFLFSEKNC